MSSVARVNSRNLLSEKDFSPDQAAACDWAYEHDQSLLHLPVGFGKTVVSQTAVEALQAAGALGRVLVVAPLRVCTDTWASEWRNWSHLHPVAVAAGLDAKLRREIIEDPANSIVVINYDTLKWFFTTYGADHGFDGLLLDELTKLAGGGMAFKALRPRVDSFKWRCGMTGTAAEEGLDKLFYQVMALDAGARFGTNKGRWLLEYFFPTDWEQRNWEPRPGSSALLAELMADLVFQAEAGGVKPALFVNYQYLDLPAGARDVYQAMCRDMLVELDGDVIEAANAAVMTGKLQQICSGFMYDEETVVDLHEVKARFLSSMPVKGQVMIVYQFEWELESLRQLFPDGLELRDPGARDAWAAGELGALFIHPASGGHGLNLQRSGCAAVVFWGPLWSRDRTDQVIGRVCRQGNPAPRVDVLMMVMAGSLESQVMLGRVREKGERARLFRAHLLECGENRQKGQQSDQGGRLG